jgi:hypothetical protein
MGVGPRLASVQVCPEVFCGSRRVLPAVIVPAFSKLLFLREWPHVLVDAS